MITLPEMAAEELAAFLASDVKDRFGSSHARLAEIIPFAAKLALEQAKGADAKKDATRAKRVIQATQWIADGKPRNWKYMNC